jgi:hypothetical protein
MVCFFGSLRYITYNFATYFREIHDIKKKVMVSVSIKIKKVMLTVGRRVHFRKSYWN